MRRMIKKRQPDTVALEAETEIEAEVVEATPTPIVTDPGDVVENNLIGLTEDCAQADADELQTDDALEVVEALESIALALDTCAKHGGMDRHSAHVVDIAVGHLYRQVGVQNSTMPALESFTGKATRISATNAAMEGLKENIAAIWKAIVAMIEKAIAWAINFFKSVLYVAEGLISRAKKLADKIVATNGEVTERAIEDERLVQTLHIKGSVPLKLATDLERFGTVVNDVFATSTSYSAKTAPNVVEEISKLRDPAMIERLELPAYSAPYAKEVLNPETSGFPSPIEGLTVFRSDELFGGKAIISNGPKVSLKGKDAVKVIGGISSVVGLYDPKAALPTKAELPILSKDDATTVCVSVQKYAEDMRSYKNEVTKLDEIKQRLLALAKSAATEANTAQADVADNLDVVKKVATATIRIIDQPAAPMAKYSVLVSKALLDYVDASLKMYK